MVNGRPSWLLRMALAAAGAALLPCAATSAAAEEPDALEAREVCPGDRPWTSPDGKVLAVVRGEDDAGDVDAHGRAARTSRVWFHDLATGREFHSYIHCLALCAARTANAGCGASRQMEGYGTTETRPVPSAAVSANRRRSGPRRSKARS